MSRNQRRLEHPAPAANAPEMLAQRSFGPQSAQPMALPHRIGNMAIQAKLTVGAVNDPAEAEADRAADAVMNRGTVEIQRASAGAPSAAAAEPDAVSTSTEQSIQQARGGGQSLPSQVEEQMGGAFGADFSGVRVHTNPQADSLNQTLSARAFTTGSDIFFRQGEYQPGSSEGQRLLAHELTHVVQQGSAVARKPAAGGHESACGCDTCTVQRQVTSDVGARTVQPSSASHESACGCDTCNIQRKVVTSAAPSIQRCSGGHSGGHQHGCGCPTCAPTPTSQILRRSPASTAAAQTLRRSPAAISVGASSSVIRRHGSAEHMLLGQVKPSELAGVADTSIKAEHRLHVLRGEQRRVRSWHERGPEAITEKDGDGQRMVAVGADKKLWVTYGELNAMPDYVGSPKDIDEGKANILAPIIQHIRYEASKYIEKKMVEVAKNEIAELKRKYAEDHPIWNMVPFSGYDPETEARIKELKELKDEPAVANEWKEWFPTVGGISTKGIQEVREINALTEGEGTNHYAEVLARNACHFAPFSWDRWRHFHNEARTIALQARGEKSDAKKKELTNLAWINNGYADHFLQDSFAAGHLINKTLIMQWYVDWIERKNTEVEAENRAIQARNAAEFAKHGEDGNFESEKSTISTPWAWNKVKTMTQANQPNLSAPQAYAGPHRPGAEQQSADPQTAEEQATRQQRMNKSGVRADPANGLSQDQAYMNYLTFLQTGAVQSITASLHDMFCKDGLRVRSKQSGDESFYIYGDYEMLNQSSKPGIVEGVLAAATAAQLSQKAVDETLKNGATQISVEQIFNYMPTAVEFKSGDRKQWFTLDAWHGTAQHPGPLREFAEKNIFEPNWHTVKNWASPLLLDMPQVSQDMPKGYNAATDAIRGTVDPKVNAGQEWLKQQLENLKSKLPQKPSHDPF